MASNKDVGLYPQNNVTALIQNPDDLQAALTELEAAGFSDDDIAVLCGDKGLEIIDSAGKYHGWRGRVRRTLQILGDTQRDLQHYEQALKAGHFAIAVPVKDAQAKKQVVDLLKKHKGYGMHYFGRVVIEDL